MKELRKKTNTELEKELSEKVTALNDFKFGSSGSKTKNVRAGRNLKKEIARMLTVMNENKKK